VGQGVRHCRLRLVDGDLGTHGQSLHTSRSLVVEALSLELMAEVGAHKLRQEEDLVWGGHGGTQVPWDKIRSNIADKLPGGCVCADMSDQACKIPDCSPDTQCDVLWGEHTDTHLRQSSIHISHTTSIPACA